MEYKYISLCNKGKGVWILWKGDEKPRFFRHFVGHQRKTLSKL